MGKKTHCLWQTQLYTNIENTTKPKWFKTLKPKEWTNKTQRKQQALNKLNLNGIKQAKQELYINEKFKSTERSDISIYQNVQGKIRYNLTYLSAYSQSRKTEFK